MRKPTLGRFGRALRLCYGIVPAVFGYVILCLSVSESVPLILCSVLFLLGGVGMLVTSIWSPGGQRLPPVDWRWRVARVSMRHDKRHIY
jgi:hypothetical protein